MKGQMIGILHPGNMGASVAASLKAAGNEVFWASEGRSQATRERAHKAGLQDLGTVRELSAACAVIVSICPPHAASSVAAQIVADGFTGLLLDANAISPQTAQSISARTIEAGAEFMDGGIIGGPAWTAGETTLYLSGPAARQLAPSLEGGPLEIMVIGTEVGRASALKMCYAAYTKGTTALLTSILAAAGCYGVREDLERQWSLDDASFKDRTHRRVRRVTSKAWRCIGEMEEISATFRSAGLPGEFHSAAADVYRKLEGLEKEAELPSLDVILSKVLEP